MSNQYYTCGNRIISYLDSDNTVPYTVSVISKRSLRRLRKKQRKQTIRHMNKIMSQMDTFTFDQTVQLDDTKKNTNKNTDKNTNKNTDNNTNKNTDNNDIVMDSMITD